MGGFGDFRTNSVADAALDALFPVSVTGPAVLIQSQGPVIDGGAEGDAAAAVVTKARLLDFFHQIGEGFHNPSSGPAAAGPCLAWAMSGRRCSSPRPIATNLSYALPMA
jgi:hypothetical protein